VHPGGDVPDRVLLGEVLDFVAFDGRLDGNGSARPRSAMRTPTAADTISLA
jgi:hypothetical protein